MLKFYGSPASSAGRSHWMLEECGIPYEYNLIDLRDAKAVAAYREKVNPGGRIPYIIDGDLRLAESVAINFYLAEKYAPALWGQKVEERAHIFQWSLWAITNLQPLVYETMMHTFLLPEAQRNPTRAEEGRAGAHELIEQLESQLPVSGYAACDRFTVADVNLCSVVGWAASMGVAIPPRVKAWLDVVRARPAYIRATTPREPDNK
jgi:glutathione S-transferase